ncbi:MAG TPA: MBL fold metallo-hydrolase [Polyangiaceae bacterium]|nr:MBL fold metallo-hydrolase [Polyangiaceae bacterium]HMR77781.1 MBL fold metallo-hydrolase [Polyangiaceae bacterium]
MARENLRSQLRAGVERVKIRGDLRRRLERAGGTTGSRRRNDGYSGARLDRGPPMPRLFDLPIHVSSRWIFNCYVVELDGGAALVVDPGLPVTATGALEALRELEAESVTVVSSHGHSDHVGGIPTLLGAVRGKVWLPARCEAYLAGELPRAPGLREVAKILPVFGDQRFDWQAVREFAGEASKQGYGRSPRMQISFEVEGFLRDGDTIENAPGWEVLHTPGHTDDSTCLYHRASATLISGDAVLTHAGRAWFNPEVTDRGASNDTETRLRELDVRHLLPGHGKPIAGKALLRDARSFRDQPETRSTLSRIARRVGSW